MRPGSARRRLGSRRRPWSRLTPRCAAEPRPPATGIAGRAASAADAARTWARRAAGADAGHAGITLDSRLVAARATCTSRCPARHRHGAEFAGRGGRGRGAVAVLTDPPARAGWPRGPAAVPVVVVDDPRRAMAELAARVYGQPGRRLTDVRRSPAPTARPPRRTCWRPRCAPPGVRDRGDRHHRLPARRPAARRPADHRHHPGGARAAGAARP